MNADEKPDLSHGKKLSKAVSGLISSHFRLFVIELNEQKQHLLKQVILLSLVLIFGLLSLLALTALIIIAFWDSYRIWAVVGVVVFYVLATLICLWRWKVSSRHSPPAFADSLEQLAKAREELFNEE